MKTEMNLCPAEDELFDSVSDNRMTASLLSHIINCDSCCHEIQEILLDSAYSGMETNVGNIRTENGIRVDFGSPFWRIPVPAFRSEEQSVIYSSIVALDRDYVMLELSGTSDGMHLTLEKGRKNPTPTRISLYINGQLLEKLTLRDRHRWELSRLKAGHYRLEMENKIPLQFKIEE